jgi:hypothetical protein
VGGLIEVEYLAVFELFDFLARRAIQRLAARATSDATGACSVSFNVAALLSKTVISRASQ